MAAGTGVVSATALSILMLYFSGGTPSLLVLDRSVGSDDSTLFIGTDGSDCIGPLPLSGSGAAMTAKLDVIKGASAGSGDPNEALSGPLVGFLTPSGSATAVTTMNESSVLGDVARRTSTAAEAPCWIAGSCTGFSLETGVPALLISSSTAWAGSRGSVAATEDGVPGMICETPRYLFCVSTVGCTGTGADACIAGSGGRSTGAVVTPCTIPGGRLGCG